MKCVIDIETTGLNPDKDDILEIGIISDDASIEPFYEHLKTRKRCRHKLTSHDGMTKKKFFKKFYEWLSNNNIFVIEPIGHNYAAFDRCFLIKFFRKKEYEKIFSHRITDTLIIARFLGFKKCGLIELAESLNCDVHNLRPHRALDDAIITQKVYQKLKDICKLK